MEKSVEVVDGKIVLSGDLKAWLEQGQELAAFLEGDTLILKRLRLPAVSRIAERAPDDPEISLTEVADEVHVYRQERRRAGRP